MAAIGCGLMLSACSDNDYMETDKGHDLLTLTASQAAEQLSEATHASEAITLNWTTGTNHGSGNRIDYTLEIAPAGLLVDGLAREPERLASRQVLCHRGTGHLA